jgi:hypothetical protein
MNRQETVALLAGVVGAARTHAGTRNTGNLLCCRGDLATAPIGRRARQASEGLILPMNPGNAGGGKEP